MSTKYVKDFEFPSEFGFTRSTKGFAKGGSVHSDAAQDKKMVKAAVHKHEKAQHKGQPLTKLKKGGEAKVKSESAAKKYTRRESVKGGKAIEKGVEKKIKSERKLPAPATEWDRVFGERVPPMTEASRKMLRDAAREVELENIRLREGMGDYGIEPGDEGMDIFGEWIPPMTERERFMLENYKRGGQVRSQKGKGSYNREPLVGLKCGGKYKK